MFCPKCGNADQTPESFCRKCGSYLPDFDKLKNREISPEEHLKVNTVLNVMTAVASLTLAVLLYSIFWGKAETPVVIYVTAGFLTAMFAWQAQAFWRNLKLRQHFRRRGAAGNQVESPETGALSPPAEAAQNYLPEADFTDFVPSTVTERTTRKIKIKK